jgi:hypothetical protein
LSRGSENHAANSLLKVTKVEGKDSRSSCLEVSFLVLSFLLGLR